MVVPADEYDDVVYHHKQPSQAIFVARGTEPTSYKDWNADLQLGTGDTPETIEKNIQKQEKIIKDTPLTQPSKIYDAQATKENLENNQFVQYDKFVNDSLKKYQPKEYSFTGHSLRC